MSRFVLPGEDIASDDLTLGGNSNKPVTLGPGLSHRPPTMIVTTAAGTLASAARRRMAWIDTNGQGRYTPAVGDQVIAQVHHSGMDIYHCVLAPHSALVTLGQLAFENVSRKTRPQLHSGSLVYARIATVHRDLDTEIECVHPSTGKAEGMGELKRGMLFDLSLNMARRLLMPKSREVGKVTILDELGERGIPFEIAVGRNGLLWIHSRAPQATIEIGRTVQRVDQEQMTTEEQARLAKQIAMKLQQS